MINLTWTFSGTPHSTAISAVENWVVTAVWTQSYQHTNLHYIISTWWQLS